MGAEAIAKDKTLLNVAEFAEKTGLKESYIRYLKQYKGLPFYKIGGLKFTISDFEEWRRKQRTAMKKG